MAFGGKPIKKHDGSFNNSSVRLPYPDFLPADMGDSPNGNAAISKIDNIFHRFLRTSFLVVRTPNGYLRRAYEQKKNYEAYFECHGVISFPYSQMAGFFIDAANQLLEFLLKNTVFRF